MRNLNMMPRHTEVPSSMQRFDYRILGHDSSDDKHRRRTATQPKLLTNPFFELILFVSLVPSPTLGLVRFQIYVGARYQPPLEL